MLFYSVQLSFLSLRVLNLYNFAGFTSDIAVNNWVSSVDSSSEIGYASSIFTTVCRQIVELSSSNEIAFLKGLRRVLVRRGKVKVFPVPLPQPFPPASTSSFIREDLLCDLLGKSFRDPDLDPDLDPVLDDPWMMPDPIIPEPERDPWLFPYGTDFTDWLRLLIGVLRPRIKKKVIFAQTFCNDWCQRYFCNFLLLQVFSYKQSSTWVQIRPVKSKLDFLLSFQVCL